MNNINKNYVIDSELKPYVAFASEYHALPRKAHNEVLNEIKAAMLGGAYNNNKLTHIHKIYQDRLVDRSNIFRSFGNESYKILLKKRGIKTETPDTQGFVKFVKKTLDASDFTPMSYEKFVDMAKQLAKKSSRRLKSPTTISSSSSSSGELTSLASSSALMSISRTASKTEEKG